jgi:hypothetical protein
VTGDLCFGQQLQSELETGSGRNAELVHNADLVHNVELVHNAKLLYSVKDIRRGWGTRVAFARKVPQKVENEIVGVVNERESISPCVGAV